MAALIYALKRFKIVFVFSAILADFSRKKTMPQNYFMKRLLFWFSLLSQKKEAREFIPGPEKKNCYPLKNYPLNQ